MFLKILKKNNNKSQLIKLIDVDEVFKKFLTEDEINEVDKEVEELYKV